MEMELLGINASRDEKAQFTLSTAILITTEVQYKSMIALLPFD